MLKFIVLFCLVSYSRCAEPASGGSLDDLINNVFTKGPDDAVDIDSLGPNNGGQTTNNNGGQTTNSNGGQTTIDNSGTNGNFPDSGGMNVIFI